MEKECWKSWVKVWSIINISGCVLIVTIAVVITHLFNEDYTDKDILSNYPNILYGSAIKDSAMIKFDVIAMKRPNVMAIGSSRVMQFRNSYFIDNSFYTMGGTASSVAEAQKTFNLVKELYIPKVVILGVDLWWLNPKCTHVNRFSQMKADYKQPYRKYLRTLVLLMKNENMRKQLFQLDNMNEYDQYGSKKTVGLTAAAHNAGFRLSDGSYQYGEIIKKKPTTEEKFQDTYSRLEKGDESFEWTNEIDSVELQKLKNLIVDIKSSGCHLIVFLPPFPDEIYKRMDTDSKYHKFIHDFENSIRQLCTNTGTSFFDCSSLAWIGSDDNESIDGFHGSDLAYAKVVRKMLDDSSFCEYVDVQRLN